jgi:hypothetical protein
MLGSVPLEPGSGPDIPTDPSPTGIDEPEGGTDMRTIPHNLLDDQEHHGRQFRRSIDCSNDWSSGGLSSLAAISTELMRGLFDGDKSFIRAVACELSRAFYGIVLELNNQKLRTCMERLAVAVTNASWETRSNSRSAMTSGRSLRARHGPRICRAFCEALPIGGFVVIRDRNVTLGDPPALAAIAGSVAPDTEINF